jgi:energy-coupling factor transporter ATP-binding protein EcfA2
MVGKSGQPFKKSRKYGESADDLQDRLDFVAALLALADEEIAIPADSLKAQFQLDWVKADELRVSGILEQKQRNGRITRTEKGIHRDDLVVLLATYRKEAIPKDFLEKKLNENTWKKARVEMVQYALACLRDLGILKEYESVKNQGYWKFSLLLKCKATPEENLQIIRDKWKEAFGNLPEIHHPPQLTATLNRCILGLKGDYQEAQQQLTEITTTLQNRLKDKTLSIAKVEEGSIILIVESSQTGYEQLKRLIGQEIAGFSVDYAIDEWQDICRRMLLDRKPLSSNTVIGQVYGNRNLIDEDLFVDLALVKPKRSQHPKHPQEIDPEKGSELYNREEVEKRFAYGEFLQEVIGQRTEKRLAIIGEPGAGKTTLLQKLAFWLLQETDDLVVWVSLAELGSLPLGEYLQQKWLTEALGLSREEIKADWEQKFRGGTVWLLLDGLDEISQSDQQALKFQGWVRDAQRIVIHMIVTCCLNLWQANPRQLQGFQTYLTQPFDDEKMHEFIRRWFRELVAEGEDVQLAESLWSELQESGKERIKDLCRNPLRLKSLCLSWQGRKGDSFDTIAKRLGWLNEGGVDADESPPYDYPDYRGAVPRQSWGNAPDVAVFFGRTEELKTLKQWILTDHCRLVAIVGMGGIGKTSLPVKLGKGGIGKTDLSLTLVREITEAFDYIMWHDLKNSPPPENIFQEIIKFLSNHQEVDLPDENKLRIERILEYLRQNRCLIILDNIESILNQGKYVGQYRKGYEAYGELFIKTVETAHKSCLLLTSREKPKNISRIEGKNNPIRFLELRGVNYEDGKRIVENTGGGSFYASDKEWEKLITMFNGNPLALELTGKHIMEVFNGNIANFLQQDQHIFGSPLEDDQEDERDDMRKLLDWHFNRLSDSEQEIVYWLAINRIPMSASDLKRDILLQESRKNIVANLSLILHRFILEKVAEKFTLQPVILEYIVDRFVDTVAEEISNNIIISHGFFNKYSLIKSSIDEYIREEQIRLILNPI